jgi:DNA primase
MSRRPIGSCSTSIPTKGLDFEAVRKAAFHFRDILQSIGLETFPMVTGGKGIHVIAPLVPQGRVAGGEGFAHRLAQAVAQSDPENFTAALPKAQRKGRIFVDYLRNQRGATAVMPYAVARGPRRRSRRRSPGRKWRRSTSRRTSISATRRIGEIADQVLPDL